MICTKRLDLEQARDYEDELEDVTVMRNYREIPYDPNILEIIIRESERAYINEVRENEECDTERYDLLQRVRRVMNIKLTPRPRQVLSLFAAGGLNFSEIGEKLGISKQAAYKSYKRGVSILQAHFSNDRFNYPKTGLPVQVRVFALDDDDEKREFCEFINRVEVMQISYTADDEFNSVMVMFKEK